MDTNRLIKLLNLTTSTNDHEALIAMRKANEMVEGNWEGVFHVPPDVPMPDRSPFEEWKETESLIARTLEIIRANQELLSESGQRWFGIMERNFESHRTLTQRQLNVLQGIFEDVKRKIMHRAQGI
jgi:hypothetical protein